LIKIASIISLILLGLTGNSLNLDMLFGINIIFGSIFVFVSLWLYGTFWGVATAVVVQSVTLYLWGHPFAYINFILEALFVGLLIEKTRIKNLIIADMIFWFGFGIWFILFGYGYVMEIEPFQVELIALKQPINEIFNVTVANIIIILFLQRQHRRLIPFQEITFTLMISVAIFSLYSISIFNSKNSFDSYKESIIEKINSISLFIKTELLRAGERGRVSSVEVEQAIHYADSITNSGKEADIYLIKNSREVIYSSKYGSKSRDRFYNDIFVKGERFKVNINIYQLFPSKVDPVIIKWKESLFYREFTAPGNRAYKIVVMVPFKPYLHKLQQLYIDSFYIIIVTIILISLLSIYTSRYLIRGVNNLKSVTANLKEKILYNKRLFWGHSYIEEIEELQKNIKGITDSLRKIFEESERRYRDMFTKSQDPLIIIDSKLFTILDVNRKLEDLMGINRDELLHHRVSRVIPHLTVDTLQDFSDSSDDMYHLLNEKRTPIKINITPVVIKDREVWLIQIKDWTAQIEVDKNEKLIRTVFETTSEGIVITDENKNILMVNSGFEKITGFSSNEVIGQTPKILYSGWQDKSFYRKMWKEITRNGSWEGEIWNRNKSGNLYTEWLTIYKVQGGYVATFIDITEKKRAKDKINRLAFYDALTSLPNRTLFRERFNSTINKASDSNEKFAVLFIDIDNFKNINDALGHQIGDLLLKSISERITGQLDKSDTVARVGGDEFMVIIENIDSSVEVATISENILSEIGKPFDINGNSLYTSASIGIGIYPEDGEDYGTLIKNVDIAMYRAKDKGKNSFEFFTDEINRDTQDRIRIENGLREAIQDKEFKLYYQPQIDSNEKIVGVEALIRWFSKDGFIPPDKFIPIAENSGQMGEIEDWVVKESARVVKRWRDRGITGIKMSINISNHQFSKPNFVENIKNLICSEDLLCSYFDLELTERIVSNDDRETVEKLNQLKEAEFHLSLDDFGTGQSSLSYLQKFNIDKLKIDKSFVDGIPENHQNGTIIDAIVSLSKAFGMSVIAEGVETEEQVKDLQSRGCYLYQGYHFSRPIPADDFERFYFERSKL
jgi:diguanylate cyclase (GGDEF)-like protein/PAS domain S-box-containing protein